MQEASSEHMRPFGCEREADDVLTPEGKTSAALSQLLERADVDDGEFLFGGVATLLPAVPGLFVDDIGSIPVPLAEERKDKLLAQCEKMSTNTWSLLVDQVKMKNPGWAIAVHKLGEMVGDRLGFKRIKLQC